MQREGSFKDFEITGGTTPWTTRRIDVIVVNEKLIVVPFRLIKRFKVTYNK